MRRLAKGTTLALWGGGLYYGIEVVYKALFPGGITHWSMAVLGGVMFLLIGGLNNWLPWEMSLALQATLGAVLVTAAELVAGCLLNLCLGLGIWDYSRLPPHLWGQICLGFALLWVPLSLGAIVLDDWLRHWLWGEERPYYHFFL